MSESNQVRAHFNLQNPWKPRCKLSHSGSESKESACNAGDPGSFPRLGRCPGGGHVNSLHILSGKSHGQRILAGYRP